MKMSRKRKVAVHVAIATTDPGDGNDDTKGSSGKNLYLVPFFNFLFYIGYFPFRLEFDAKQDKYVEKTYRAQQVLCVLSNTGSLSLMIYYTTSGLVMILRNRHNSFGIDINIFDIVSNFGLVITSILFVYMGWRRKTVFLELIDNTRVTGISDRNVRTICALVYCCCTLLVISFGFLDWMMMIHYVNLNQAQQPSERLDDPIFGGSYALDQNGDIGSYIGALIYILILSVYVYLILFYSIYQSAFMVLVLTLRQLGNEFARKLRDEGFMGGFGNEGLPQGLSLYKNLKSVTDMVKIVFGNQLIFYYISSVSYLAEAPHVMLGNRPEYERLIMIYSVLSMVVWILAAEFHHSVRNDLVKWMEHHFDRADLSTDDRLKLLTVVSEISSNDMTTVALSNKCFPVTYKYLSSMIGLIVTYGIIVFQLHHGKFLSSNDAGTESDKNSTG